ncbi:T6SS immunity protein Tli4 family protein [Holophaga foetida]|uniref:T6SS immunity protein Tli4 family protein n=1 Tax=Holophaga foetida TaxID=35839 RepID=UPI0002472A75|nr:T6SS immunity protein Tli4 family protein [Holophaga foetida]
MMSTLRWLAILLCLSVLGCSRGCAQQPPGPKGPDLEDIQKATHPGYVTPPGIRQECLGRLVFDVPRAMEWGIAYTAWRDFSENHNYEGFPGDIAGEDEHSQVGRIAIRVMGPVPRKGLEEQIQLHAVGKSLAIKRLKSESEGKTWTIETLRENPNKEDPIAIAKSLQELETDIHENETRSKAIEKAWHPYDLEIPDSVAYVAGSTLYAYLWRDGRLHCFMDSQGDGEPPLEIRKPKFDAFVRAYRPRKLYEIPTERGICLPYGFVPDDGTTTYDIKVSLRYQDTPGVIYTLGTATVGELGSEPAWFHSTSSAMAGIGGELEGYKVDRIGPRSARIGALTAQQGGIVVHQRPKGKAPFETYLMYTGYGGWGDSQVLPTVSLDLRCFTADKEGAPILKKNPPPFSVTYSRYEGLLKSLRMRPTIPLMPEFEKLKPTTK